MFMVAAQVPRQLGEAISINLATQPVLAHAAMMPLLSLLMQLLRGGHTCRAAGAEPSEIALNIRQQLLLAQVFQHLPVLLAAAAKDAEGLQQTPVVMPQDLQCTPCLGTWAAEAQQEAALPWHVKQLQHLEYAGDLLQLQALLCSLWAHAQVPTSRVVQCLLPTAVDLTASLVQLCLHGLETLPEDGKPNNGIRQALRIAFSTFNHTLSIMAELIDAEQSDVPAAKNNRHVSQQNSKLRLSNLQKPRAVTICEVMDSQSWIACTCLFTVLSAYSLLLSEEVGAEEAEPNLFHGKPLTSRLNDALLGCINGQAAAQQVVWDLASARQDRSPAAHVRLLQLFGVSGRAAVLAAGAVSHMFVPSAWRQALANLPLLWRTPECIKELSTRLSEQEPLPQLMQLHEQCKDTGLKIDVELLLSCVVLHCAAHCQVSGSHFLRVSYNAAMLAADLTSLISCRGFLHFKLSATRHLYGHHEGDEVGPAAPQPAGSCINGAELADLTDQQLESITHVLTQLLPKAEQESIGALEQRPKASFASRRLDATAGAELAYARQQGPASGNSSQASSEGAHKPQGASAGTPKGLLHHSATHSTPATQAPNSTDTAAAALDATVLVVCRAAGSLDTLTGAMRQQPRTGTSFMTPFDSLSLQSLMDQSTMAVKEAWQRHVVQLTRCLDSFVRKDASHCLGQPSCCDAVFSLPALCCVIDNKYDEATEGVLLHTALAASSNSQEQQQQLCSLLFSLLKLSSRLGPKMQSEADGCRVAAASAAVLVLLEHCMAMMPQSGDSDMQHPASCTDDIAAASSSSRSSTSSCRSGSSSCSFSAAQSPIVEGLPPKLARPLHVEEGTVAPARSRVGILQWLVLFGRCCLQWSHVLQRLPPGTKFQRLESSNSTWQAGQSEVMHELRLHQTQDIFSQLMTPSADREDCGRFGFPHQWYNHTDQPLFAKWLKSCKACLQDSSISAQLSAAGLSLLILLIMRLSLQPVLQGMHGTQAALDAATGAGGKGGHSTDAAAVLAQQLEALGLSLNTVPITSACNNPLCGNMDGPSEQKLVKGKAHTCSQCRAARYCSKACSAQHWRHHKRVCKELAAHAATIATAAKTSPAGAGGLPVA